MSTVEVTYYQVKCDCCGTVCDDYGDYSAWSTPDSACINLPSDWQSVSVGGSRVVEDLCSECWCWPEDHPEHLGDDEWTGSDDPVRKHAVHPEAVTE